MGRHLVLLQLEGRTANKTSRYLEGYSGTVKCRKCGRQFDPAQPGGCKGSFHPVEFLFLEGGGPMRDYKDFYTFGCCGQLSVADNEPQQAPGCTSCSTKHQI